MDAIKITTCKTPKPFGYKGKDGKRNGNGY